MDGEGLLLWQGVAGNGRHCQQLYRVVAGTRRKPIRRALEEKL